MYKTPSPLAYRVWPREGRRCAGGKQGQPLIKGLIIGKMKLLQMSKAPPPMANEHVLNPQLEMHLQTFILSSHLLLYVPLHTPLIKGINM